MYPIRFYFKHNIQKKTRNETGKNYLKLKKRVTEL